MTFASFRTDLIFGLSSPLDWRSPTSRSSFLFFCAFTVLLSVVSRFVFFLLGFTPLLIMCSFLLDLFLSLCVYSSSVRRLRDAGYGSKLLLVHIGALLLSLSALIVLLVLFLGFSGGMEALSGASIPPFELSFLTAFEIFLIVAFLILVLASILVSLITSVWLVARLSRPSVVSPSSTPSPRR